LQEGKEPVKLIVGLGNPGEKYRLHRHNMGFLVLDYLSKHWNIPITDKGFKSCFARGKIGDVPVILAKPQTYMNLSGSAVRVLMDYYRVPVEDLLVVHDDLDLSFSTIRLKAGGGHGGHKGLVSIIDHLRREDFLRVRLGIGRPREKALVEAYVLQPFSDDEMEALPPLIAHAGDAVTEAISSGIEAAMRKYHGRSIMKFNEEV
jgi:peptidyl-tRNA hydrolase, PTH1 family